MVLLKITMSLWFFKMYYTFSKTVLKLYIATKLKKTPFLIVQFEVYLYRTVNEFFQLTFDALFQICGAIFLKLGIW